MWQDPQQLSRILGHFADVVAVGTEGHRWIVHGPGGREVSWQTRTIADEPGERVRWATAPDASVHNEGTVRFREAAGDRGTRVTLSVSFDPPGGTIGTAALKRLDVVPEALVGEALDRFKSLAESGEIPTLDDNPSARGAGDLV
jgi:uncharacterized membrane protein